MHFRIIVIVRYGIWFPVFSLNFGLQALHSGFLPLWGIFLHSFISCFTWLVCASSALFGVLHPVYWLHSFCTSPLFFVKASAYHLFFPPSFCLLDFFVLQFVSFCIFFFFVLWAPVCSHNITLYFLFLPNLLHDKYCFMLKSQHNTKD